MTGWVKVSGASKYVQSEKRTIYSWMKDGLKYSRLPSGRVLIKLSDIDAYLEQFAITEAEGSKLDKIVTAVLREVI